MNQRLIRAAALSGWGFFVLALYMWPAKPAPLVQTKTEYVDRVQTVTQLRTITKPDGTKTVVETRTDTKEVERLKVETKTVKPPLPKYSAAVSVEPKLFDLQQPLIYRLELSRRLWESPVWTTIEASSDRTVSVGLRYEF